MKPKRLSLSEIWELYLLLKPALDKREQKELLIDEIEMLLRNSKPGTLVASLNIMYDNITKQELNPILSALLFIEGLKQNNFFAFVSFVKGISDGSS